MASVFGAKIKFSHKSFKNKLFEVLTIDLSI
jgi:hypothetical protein